MEFHINNNFFSDNINFDINNVIVKSLFKEYNVIYENIDNIYIVNNLIGINDFLIIDHNVFKLHNSFYNSLKNKYIVDAIEEKKTMSIVMEIVDYLTKAKITKNNNIIVIGGGLTQDIGGFVSTIFKRGINWILIPTTLLCMTDSSIGSKICLNTESKNLLGMFNPPNKIYITTYFLNTLDKEQINSGLGEALKLSLIGGHNTYNIYKELVKENDYLKIIKLSMAIKKIIIEKDEFEKNERKVLNYGHTIGHALESISNYEIPHGIAISIGMYIKNILFFDNKYDHVNNEILNLINKKYFNISFSYELFLNHIKNDKKNIDINVCFIVLDDIGNTKTIFVELDEVKDKLFNVMKKIFNNIY